MVYQDHLTKLCALKLLTSKSAAEVKNENVRSQNTKSNQMWRIHEENTSSYFLKVWAKAKDISVFSSYAEITNSNNKENKTKMNDACSYHRR